MEFRVLTSAEVESFLSASNDWLYNQSPASLEVFQSKGGQGEIVGLVDQGKIVASARVNYLPYRKIFLSAEIYFGPVFDQTQPEIFDQFLSALQVYLGHKRRIIRLRLSPFLVRARIDGALEVSPDPLAERYDQILADHGLNRLDLNYDQMAGLQASYFYVKDLEGQNEDEVRASLTVNCRNHMRTASRFGLKIRFLKPDEVDIFNQMLKATVARTGMPEFVVNYLTKQELETYGDCLKLPLAYIDRDHSLSILEEQVAEWQAKLDDLATKSDSKRNQARAREAEAALTAARRRQKQVVDFCDSQGDLVNLACSQYLFTGSDCIYLQSAAYEESFLFSAVYAIHDLMIHQAVEAGVKRYNMFAVSDPFAEDTGDAQVAQFKANFNGYTMQLLGNYEQKLSFLA